MTGPMLLHLAVLMLGIGGLGWLLHRTWPGVPETSWRLSAGLVFCGLTVLFSILVSIAGYHFKLIGTAYLIVALGILAASWLTPRSRSAKIPFFPESGGRTGWLYYLFVFGCFVAPAFLLYLPLDTDAQGFGYLALMMRKGGTVNTLAPWQPDVRYLYSPAAFIWWAFLSDLLGLPMHQVMLPFTHIMAGFAALVCIDLGQALLPNMPRARWLMPLMIIGGTGLMTTVLDSAYTSALGLLTTIVFLTFAFHAVRDPRFSVISQAAVALASISLMHPDTIVILLLGYLPFYASFWLVRCPDRNRAVWIRLFVLIPALGMLLTLPWLVQAWPLLLIPEIAAPVGTELLPPGVWHFTQLVVFNGVLIPLLAVCGLVIAARRRSVGDMLMITWLAFVIDFSIVGLVDRVAGGIGIHVMRFMYPTGMAWHGPIIPYAYLAVVAVDFTLNRWPVTLPRRLATASLAGGVGLIALVLIFQRPLLLAGRNVLRFYGTFSSRADLAAMAYLREHAAADALVLNYPDGQEGHWVPVLAERESVSFRLNAFLTGTRPYIERRETLRAAYYDPTRDASRALLYQYGVTHIVIPQIINQPERFGDIDGMIRSKWPEGIWRPLDSSPARTPWLELVFDQDGAQVYRVLPPQ